MFDRCRNGWNVDQMDWQPCHAAKWWLAVWLGWALRPHTAVFGGRHSVRSALRPRPTACANVDTAHILFRLAGLLSPTGLVWPHWPVFFITAQNGRTGVAAARPLSLVVLPCQLLAFFIFVWMAQQEAMCKIKLLLLLLLLLLHDLCRANFENRVS